MAKQPEAPEEAKSNVGSAKAEGPDIVRILSCLLNSLLKALVVGLAFLVVGWLAYLYMRTPAGAWTYDFIGFNRDTTLIMAVAMLGLFRVSLWWLVLLCLIIWWWKKGLQKTRPG